MIYDQTTVPRRYNKARTLQPDVMGVWIKEVQMMTRINEKSILLDLGCGTGRFSVPMAIHYGSTVIGIDPSDDMLSRAKSDSVRPGRRIRFAKGTAEDIPLDDESVDVVFMSMAIHHIQDMQSAVSEIARVLKGGGMLVIRNYITESLPLVPYLSFFSRSDEVIREDVAIKVGYRGLVCRKFQLGIAQRDSTANRIRLG